MRDKIVFHIRFICVYSVCLALALAVSFGLREYLDQSYGFGLQVLAFAVAFLATRRTHRDYLEHLIAQSNRILFDRLILSVVLIAAVSSALAVGIDWLVVPLSNYFNIPSLEWVDINRAITLGFVYLIIAYFASERAAAKLIKQGRFVLSEIAPPTLPPVIAPEAASAPYEQIMELLVELPEEKRETLIKGALSPGAPMITLQGSTNDQLWTALSKYGWTKRARLARSMKKQISKANAGNKLVGWTVTQKGAEALARINKDNPRANLRVVNA